MGKQAELVVIADSGANARNADSDRAMARLSYGCASNSSCFVLVNSHDDLVKKLRAYDDIDRLVFLLHGVPGSVEVNHRFIDLVKLAGMLKGAKTIVHKEIVFEGCYLGGDPAQMLPIMEALRAPRAFGYAAWHFWALVPPFKISKGDSAVMLDAKLKKFKEYLLPNQPGAAELVKTPGEKRLYYEWFSRDINDDKFPNTDAERRDHLSRSRLVNVTYTAEQAKTAVNELTVQGGPLFAVTVLAALRVHLIDHTP